MFLKERDNPFVQVFQTSHPIGHSILAVSSHHTAPEKALECVEELNVPPMLDYGEFRKHLYLAGHLWVWIDADEEASFAVHESDHPVGF